MKKLNSTEYALNMRGHGHCDFYAISSRNVLPQDCEIVYVTIGTFHRAVTLRITGFVVNQFNFGKVIKSQIIIFSEFVKSLMG